MRDSASRQDHMIDLHIEKTVLEGFSIPDQPRIASVVQRELHRLLSQGELPAILKQNGSIEQLDGTSFQAKAGESIESTGIQIAHSLYGGLKR